ncbi:MAG: Hsp70 family protein [Deltaproteobacteria bacterium]|nr:Hsp70 family protein [Deltaproteobacteria bacterium]
MSAKFSIGIDLGTTNSTVAFTALDDDELKVEVLPLPQVIHAGEAASHGQLPSFLYTAGEDELAPGALRLPFHDVESESSSSTICVGMFARDRGAEVPGRVVSSAKSWLSHPHVDRRSPLLPFEGADDVDKASPVAVSASFLRHMLLAWNHAFPDAPFAEQQVTLTVPASFDAVAKQLTEEAAKAAGFAEFTLLEEPQAAMYAWISGGAASDSSWRKQVEAGDEMLVVDVGGGTCDFSLIEVLDDDGELELSRKAVGEHILLGGDNMDAALAVSLKAEIENDGKRISDWQLRSMIHSCRKAKEELLDDKSDISEVAIVIPGRGKSLIGKSLRCDLKKSLVENVVLDGFLPLSCLDDKPASFKRGLVTMGLPFAQDAAITKHLSAFLSAHQKSESAALQESSSEGVSRIPSKILFNGGVTRSTKVQQRILATLSSWAKELGQPSPQLLDGSDVDLAVAKGAAYYGAVRLGRGVRIKGGTARAYYVGIERAGLAIPGMAPTVDAVCVAPMGMEEDSKIELPLELGLYVGEPVSFRFFASTERREDEVGTVCHLDDVDEIAPIETVLDGEAGAMVPGKLSVHVTPIGTLDLQVQDSTSSRNWHFSFNVRVQ